MTLQELRYLVAVADERHFARAATACHVSQPTLSTQIKKLEDYLGVVLLDRSQRSVRPTPVGEQVIAQARIVIEEFDKIRPLVRSKGDPMEGPLRLGVIPTLGPYLIPQLLPALRARYPKLRLLLREDLTANLLERLSAGTLDAALLALPVPGDGLAASELFREPFQVALPQGHALARKRRLQEEDLTGESVLLLEEGHCLRDQALEICGATRSPDSEEIRATSLETLRQMVAAGIGCTLLPALAVATGAADTGLTEIRPFARPAPTRTIGIVSRTRFPRAEAVSRLGELVKETAHKLLAG